MAGIFINYRREDASAYAGRLYDSLVSRFGRDRVFIDIDAIGPGDDYRVAIHRTCTTCDVMLAVIGRNWATVRDKNGKLRLENDNDLVRLEITSALQRGLHVIPILVGGADMPESAVLPLDLQDLAFRNAWEISDKRFHQDVQGLVEALLKMLAVTVKPTSPPEAQAVSQAPGSEDAVKPEIENDGVQPEVEIQEPPAQDLEITGFTHAQPSMPEETDEGPLAKSDLQALTTARPALERKTIEPGTRTREARLPKPRSPARPADRKGKAESADSEAFAKPQASGTTREIAKRREALLLEQRMVSGAVLKRWLVRGSSQAAKDAETEALIHRTEEIKEELSDLERLDRDASTKRNTF